jgi:hypothetical protein
MSVNSKIKYTDRREVIVEALEQLILDTVAGEVNAVGVVALRDDGGVQCQEAYKNNSDRAALIGATQILAQHIMAGDG